MATTGERERSFSIGEIAGILINPDHPHGNLRVGNGYLECPATGMRFPIRPNGIVDLVNAGEVASA